MNKQASFICRIAVYHEIFLAWEQKWKQRLYNFDSEIK